MIDGEAFPDFFRTNAGIGNAWFIAGSAKCDFVCVSAPLTSRHGPDIRSRVGL
jgi:hypothetical protein